MHTIETLIIGGGIAGSSLACALADRAAGAGAAIVDVDLFGKYSSSELNGGGVRCTFAEPINIKLALASTKYYLQHARKLDFRQRGYFWMYDPELWEEARRFLPLVRAFGLPVEAMSHQDALARFPVLSDLSDVAGVTFTPFDGRLSPHRLRMHYLDHAQRGGVQVLDRWEVVSIEGNGAPYTVRMLKVLPRKIKGVLSDVAGDSAKTPFGPAQGQRQANGREELVIRAQRVVNAAGPWSSKIAKLYGDELPVAPLPRQVYLLKHAMVNLEPLPFFLDYRRTSISVITSATASPARWSVGAIRTSGRASISPITGRRITKRT